MLQYTLSFSLFVVMTSAGARAIGKAEKAPIVPLLARSSDSANVVGPRFVIYANEPDGLLDKNWPRADDLAGWNVLNLAFLFGNDADDRTKFLPTDGALAWTKLSSATRDEIKKGYDDANISLMVSLFGWGPKPLTKGGNATEFAHQAASFVKRYDLAGCDVDFEDMDTFDDGTAEGWLVELTRVLRTELPAPQYTISHAPVAPWFRNDTHYPGRAYLRIDEDAGADIDFYNIQTYNQDADYTTCESLLYKSSSAWPGTSLFEIHASGHGIPLDKLVIGKPALCGDANGGFMAPTKLATCIEEASSQGWNGGLMMWEYHNNVHSSDWLVQAKGNAFDRPNIDSTECT